MTRYSDLPSIVNGKLLQQVSNNCINYIITDSRKIISHPEAIFFAKQGPHHDGHLFLSEMYAEGIRNFIVEKEPDTTKFKEANFIQVDSTLDALQRLAKHHREQLKMQVIGITGSNGKTIVKEWLLQLLSGKYRIIATPHSYNSQLGVPLSVWQANKNHDLGIFEAGISKEGEMDSLQKIIKPTIGLFTNIGPAHEEGFKSRRDKVVEKLKLFTNSKVLVWCGDHELLRVVLDEKSYSFDSYSWGTSELNNVVIIERRRKKEGYTVKLQEGNDIKDLYLQVKDEASFENLMHCITIMRYLKYDWKEINERISWIKKIPMRLEMKKGINDCYLIDDAYNNDLGGLEIALNFLSQQKQQSQKTAIISDIFQSGLDERILYAEVNKLLIQKGITRVFAIGPIIAKNKDLFSVPIEIFEDTDLFLKSISPDQFKNEMILIKGARVFAFERIVNRLIEKIHGTRLEINLGAITHNLNFYRSKINKKTKVMVMVKAFAYGSGIYEIANLLQYHKVDYLGVAYTDEGVNLRKNGIEIPIMIMNPSPEGFEQLLKFNLEPVVYGFDQMDSIQEFLNGRELNIHIKLDTGMHRLGFQEKYIKRLTEMLKSKENLKIKSVFSHLAAADDLTHEKFTREQAGLFKKMVGQLTSELNVHPINHLLNSAGVINFPQHQYDMIRLGIGLYGVESSGLLQDKLLPISTLKTIISQIREVPKGKTIGYGRMGIANEDKQIATIAIGYADGFNRSFSNGVGEVLVNGNRAPVIGNVCMDMTMIDVTGIDAREGDDVIIFGEEPSINELAKRIRTIPYEILTNVSERVKRVFLYD